MGFVLLDVFFFLTGAVVIKLLREYDLHIDAISLCFLLFNFSVELGDRGSPWDREVMSVGGGCVGVVLLDDSNCG